MTRQTRYTFSIYDRKGRKKASLCRAFLMERTITKGQQYLVEDNLEWNLLWDWKKAANQPHVGQFLVSFQEFYDGERIAIARPISSKLSPTTTEN